MAAPANDCLEDVNSQKCHVHLPLFKKKITYSPNMSLFHLRGQLTRAQSLTLGIVGGVLLIGLWWLLAELLAVPALDYRAPSLDDPALQNLNRDSLLQADSIRFANAKEVGKIYKILPTPLQVVQAFPKLAAEDALGKHTLHSVWLNLKGYFWAILLSLLIGGLIGFIPLFNGLFAQPVDACATCPFRRSQACSCSGSDWATA